MKLTHIYLKTVFLYSSLFVAITLVMIPIINKSNNYLIESNIESTYLTLNSQHQSIKELFTAANNINSRIHQDQMMNSNETGNLIYESDNIPKIINIRKKLSELTFLMPSAILDYQFITASGIVFTSERVYDSSESYYLHDFEYTGISHSKWLDLLNTKTMVFPVRPALIDMKNKKTDILTINFPSLNEANYHFALLIDPEALNFQLPHSQSQIHSYILNSSGDIITSANFDSTRPVLTQAPVQELVYNDVSCIAFQFDDDVFFNKLIFIIPRDYFHYAASTTIKILYLYMLITICGCITLACVLAFLHTRNFKRINEFIPPSDGPNKFFHNEFKTIVSTLNTTYDDNKLLNNKCEEIIQSLKNTVFQQLLFNNPVKESEKTSFVSSYMLDDFYRLVLIDINKSSVSEKMDVFMSIESKYSKTTAVNFINENIILLLSQKDEFNTSVLELKSHLNSFIDIQFTINISDIISNPNDLSTAFDEANIIKFFNTNNSRKEIVKFDRTTDNFLKFQLDTEKMLEILNSGNKAAYFEFISNFCNYLCGENLLCKNSIFQTYYEFRNVLISSAEKHTLDISLIPTFSYNLNWNEQYDNLVEQSLLICELISIKQSDSTPSYSSKILEYINQNYFDCDLCIPKIAQNFNISENYVSALLKEKTGKNYSDHLESIRILKSKQLLSETNQTISQISKSVGYLNENTFYKSFKRVCGISPGQFRKSI